ncbi:MAG: ABC transporter ATP-binding protein [Dorea sp.]|nr:ABC transporter ATP-binding protein [Dorea sp.]
MITCKGLEKTYYGKGIETKVLDGADLSIDRGEFVCIFGVSGSGKSTLLNILGLLDAPTGGTYFFEGTDVTHLNNREAARIRNQEMGFVFQSYHLIQELNALENIAVPMGYAGKSKKERNSTARRLLQEFGMSELEKKYLSQMSGGEQQRIAIARAIANRPKVLFADEPTGNLDNKNALMVMDMLKRLNEQGMTVVMVTHDTALAEYGSRIIRVRDGGILDE